MQLGSSQVIDKDFRCQTNDSSINLSADQILFMPFYIGASTGLSEFLQTGSLLDATRVLHHQFFGLVIQDFQVWPAIQFVNFYHVPLNLQVTFNCAISAAWRMFVNYKSQSLTENEENVSAEPLKCDS